MTQIDSLTRLSEIVFSIIVPSDRVGKADQKLEFTIHKFSIVNSDSHLISKEDVASRLELSFKSNNLKTKIRKHCENTIHISLQKLVEYPDPIRKNIEDIQTIGLQSLIEILNPNYIDSPTKKDFQNIDKILEHITSLMESLMNISLETLTDMIIISRKQKSSFEKLLKTLIIEKESEAFNSNRFITPEIYSFEDDTYNSQSIEFNAENLILETFNLEGHLSKYISDYELREDQVNMSRNILNSLENSNNSIIEAGTGTGKSIAYLVPAFLNSIKNDTTTIISTNTINLQEQLLKDDIPLTLNCLEAAGIESSIIPNFSILKGKSNYLCMRRLQTMIKKESITEEECLLLLRIVVWASQTKTGDKSELNFKTKEERFMWDQISEESSGSCRIPDRKCFFKKAKETANKSKLIITNHSLLLADINSEGSTLPAYENLIIDEAHHLEDQATKSLGFEITSYSINEILEKTENPDSVIQDCIKILRPISKDRDLESLDAYLNEIKTTITNLKENCNNLFSFDFSESENNNFNESSRLTRITEMIRTQNWDSVEETSENILLEFNTITNVISSISRMLESKTNQNVILNLYNDLNTLKSDYYKIADNLNEFIFEPANDSVYWVEKNQKNSTASLFMAPIEVDEILNINLFSSKNSVILTSATLTTDESFEHIKSRLGLNTNDLYTYKSPFKYKDVALMLTPEYIPDPRDEQYLDHVCQSIEMACLGSAGRALALFTSYSSIRSVYEKLQNSLKDKNISVLAQGISGNPQQLVNYLRKNPKTLILGTASMWEGIDLRGDALQLLIITRLPFGVPTDPIYQARSEKYDNPFVEFAIPNAILKFKQGFGRLIRSDKDKGIFLMLDNRIKTKRYGSVFIDSLPEMSQEDYRLSEISTKIREWLI